MPIIVEDDSTELVTPDELSEFPGAPFAASAVLAAGQAIRAAADWHIAPQRFETLVVTSGGGRDLLLPTMWLEQVLEIRNVTDPGDPVVLTGYSTAKTNRFRAGVLKRTTTPGRWPVGDLEVDVLHGHVGCPAELLPLAAELARKNPRVVQESLAGRSVTFGDDKTGLGGSAALAKYRILRSR